MLKRLLYIQLFALFLLLTAFVVLSSAASLAKVAEDALAESVLWWIAMGALMLAIIDLVAMVVSLALMALSSQHD